MLFIIDYWSFFVLSRSTQIISYLYRKSKWGLERECLNIKFSEHFASPFLFLKVFPHNSLLAHKKSLCSIKYFLLRMLDDYMDMISKIELLCFVHILFTLSRLRMPCISNYNGMVVVPIPSYNRLLFFWQWYCCF